MRILQIKSQVQSSTLGLSARFWRASTKSKMSTTNCHFMEALQGRKQQQVKEVDLRSHVDLYELTGSFFTPIYLNMHWLGLFSAYTPSLQAALYTGPSADDWVRKKKPQRELKRLSDPICLWFLSMKWTLLCCYIRGKVHWWTLCAVQCLNKILLSFFFSALANHFDCTFFHFKLKITAGF